MNNARCKPLLLLMLGVAVLCMGIECLGFPVFAGLGVDSVLLPVPAMSAALLSSTLIYASYPRPRREKLTIVGLGIVLELGLAMLRFGAGHGLFGTIMRVGFASGAITLLALLVLALRSSDRAQLRRILLEGSVLPVYAIVSGPLLLFTWMVHPQVLDLHFIRADHAFDALELALIAPLAEVPGLPMFCNWVYQFLPLALGLAHIAARRSAHERNRPSPLLVFVVIGAVGWVFYNLVPVVGPAPFIAKYFPDAGLPDPLRLKIASALGPTHIPRNCVPSLHTAWALAAFMAVPRSQRVLKTVLAGFLVFTLLSTLIFAYHYVVDLIMAVPFTVGIRSLCLTGSFDRTARRRTAIVSWGLFTLFLAACVFKPEWLAASPVGAYGLAALCVVAPLFADVKWLGRISADSSGEPEAGQLAPQGPNRLAQIMTGLFVLSGLSALMIEVVFSKSMALTFGSTATARTTVLATYMGGMALGAWLGGRRSELSGHPLKIYAYCELAIAAYSLVSPLVLKLLQSLYVALVLDKGLSQGTMTGLQVGLGALALLPPTVLMGATTPALVAHFSRRVEGMSGAVARLYAANTVGAGAGALLAAYLFLPTLGVFGTLACAASLSMLAALGALRVARGKSFGSDSKATPEGHGLEEPATRGKRAGLLGLGVLGLGGVVTLALEGIYVHLLAVVVGCSAYAFGLMLACFLAGLGLGSIAARKLMSLRIDEAPILAWAQLGIGATALTGLWVWNELPAYFASFANWPAGHTFGEREFIRAIVCVTCMLPSAFFIGMAYPSAMALFLQSRTKNRVAAMGRASAVNTGGNIVGAILGGFALIPWFGSFAAVQWLAGLSLILCVCAVTEVAKQLRYPLAGGLAGVLALWLTLPADFDFTRLASGANVYFQGQNYGRVIDHAESADGGLTTVGISGPKEAPVHTLLTNGKFQGDNSVQREVGAQYGIGLVPLLHCDGRGRALVLGVGTGCSARVIADAGFQQVELVDLSQDILTMADRYFSGVNGNLLHRANLRQHVTDGRHFLLTHEEKFDLVSMELSSIWFAGAASLYNQEFYTLVRDRLSERGVMQQWMQLHHISLRDIAAILATVRTEFAQVWLYYVRTQGVIIACNHDCRPTPERIAALEQFPGLAETLAPFDGHTKELQNSRLLTPDQIDTFLERAGEAMGGLESVISTDDNLLLEYSTPRGNVMSYQKSVTDNLRALLSLGQRASTAP